MPRREVVAGPEISPPEPVSRVISHSYVRSQVSAKTVKRDWVLIVLIVSEIVIILTAGALVYAMLQSN